MLDRRTFASLLLALPLRAQSALKPGRTRNTVERLAAERLAAVAATRAELAAARKRVPQVGIYEDYRSVLHIHAEDSNHTGGTRARALAAAKEAGVRAVFFSDHRGPKPETWQGMRDGVLFFAGSEDDHLLRFPTPAPGLRFLSHPEERPEMSDEGFEGMEIYNRHADAMDDKDFLEFFQSLPKDPEKLRQFAALAERYPEEVYGSGCDYWPEIFARWDSILERRRFTGIAANDAHENQVFQAGGAKLFLDPYTVAFRNTTTHILARELSEAALHTSLKEGRAYVAHDWLCDPSGFAFWAVNNLGVYEMGDTIPMTGTTRLEVRTPAPAHIKVFFDGKLLAEGRESQLTTKAPGPGVARVEAWLDVDGESRPWIYSNAIFAARPTPEQTRLPSNALEAGVERDAGITYIKGAEDDLDKHKLDVYRPAGKSNLPVLVFLHGGAWTRGDRSLYVFLGSRMAREDFLTVIPSYRLSPKHAHPAHVDDAAAAIAWTLKNINSYGGDSRRVFLAGHSSGGHLVSLVALEPGHLRRFGANPAALRGVFSLSGVYDVRIAEGRPSAVFPGDREVLRAASPLTHARAGAPPFLVGYCQWDYLLLPQQARQFHAALKDAGAESELLYVAGENHISEMVRVADEQDATAAAMLRFMRVRERSL
jgi:acetyl esterase/lipase